MATLVNPLDAVTAGQNFVNGLFTSRAQQQAAQGLASGNYAQALGALGSVGDITNVVKVQEAQAAAQKTAQEQQKQQQAQQLQSTLQIIGTVKRARTQGQDVSQILPAYRDAFIAMGTDPQQLAQIEQQVAANPAFLDQIENIIGQQARQLEIQNLGNGYGVAIDKATGQVVNEYQAPQRPMNVGNVLIDPGTGQVILDAREPKYQTIQNTDGSTSVVAIDQPAPRGGSAGDGSGVPRGIRNNNPGNIEDGPFARSLPGYRGSDGRFAIFDSPEAGINAGGELLNRYAARGVVTPAQIINRWAPPSDGNPTQAYAQYVARRLGIGVNDPVPANRRAEAFQAIKEFETGQQSPSNGAPAATSGGGARVVAQGENRGLTPAQQRAEERASQTERAASQRTEVNLRKEFDSLPEVKAYKVSQQAFRGLEAAATGPATSGSDLSLIFQFMKVLDPTSVVREGEFATAQNSGSAFERVGNLYNRVLNGTRLNERQRRDFLQQGRALFQASERTYAPVAERYRSYAQDYGVSPDRVAPVQGQQNRQRPQTNTGGAIRFNLTPAQLRVWQQLGRNGGDPSAPLGSTRNPRWINEAAAATSYNNIPRGSYYYDPNGQIRQKR